MAETENRAQPSRNAGEPLQWSRLRTRLEKATIGGEGK